MSSTAITSATSSSSTDSVANPNATLTQSNFLQLLVTQMQSQDPLNPESDTDFAAQLAQFSALQQTTNMSGSMQALQASSLIGMTVNLASSGASGSTPTSGTVTGVDLSSGTPQVLVGGKEYALSQISSITTPSTSTSTTGTSTSSTSTTGGSGS